ncbi:MAG: penicillin-binding protein 2, partial [Desulfatitalea sp.]|nr:penicillin-binding protein 2 [Desulfatitalea sp.]NNK00635.1 penicillin-binding protein 2 [Desulfatitalea sp.]
STSIAAYPAQVTNTAKTAADLAKALNRNAADLRKQLEQDRPFVWIKRQANPKEVAAVRQMRLAGIDFLPAHSRFYPNTTLAAQLLGFVGIDGQGLEGLEYYYKDQLKGSETQVTVLTDALGRGFDADRWAAVSQAGNNLILTIDRHIQYICEQSLAEAVVAHRAQSGMALVMVPRTGELLAVAHYPFFNPNAFARFHRSTWRNRAIIDPFEPGSTMKIFSVAAALESGRMVPNTIFYCENGSYPVGNHVVHDTKPYSWLSVQQIVKYSSNIGTVKVVQEIGPEILHTHLEKFGFGRRTGVDSPGESAGSLSNHSRWSNLDTGAIGFGQGISVTALQMITATAAIANNGLMMRPHVVQAISDPNGRIVHKTTPEAMGQVISMETAHTVRRIMRTVITEGGTGIKADVQGYSVCGKTGTAQKVDSKGTYAEKRYIASFVGFAPTEQPAIAVLVVVDEPKDLFYGGLVAAPVFGRIVKQTLGYMNVPPVLEKQKLRVSRTVKVSG